MTHKVNNLEGIVVTNDVTWKNPEVEPPPRGRKINVLTIGGIAIQAYWSDRAKKDGFIAWYPLIDVPDWARDIIAKNVTPPKG